MEAVAYISGEGWSDAPACTSSILTAMGRGLNDGLPDGPRQRLVPLIPRLIGTRDDGRDTARSYMALDWLIRTYAPAWLCLADLEYLADTLRGSPRAHDTASLSSLITTLNAARAAAGAAAGDAAWDAARAAAWTAAEDAAWNAAWAAARAAARDAAWNAAWAAARVAARDAAEDAAWAAEDVARDAAWNVAWNAAGDPARAAARDAAEDAAEDATWDAAWAAARAVAGDALSSTVRQLQDSAVELFVAMIEPEEGAS